MRKLRCRAEIDRRQVLGATMPRCHTTGDSSILSTIGHQPSSRCRARARRCRSSFSDAHVRDLLPSTENMLTPVCDPVSIFPSILHVLQKVRMSRGVRRRIRRKKMRKQTWRRRRERRGGGRVVVVLVGAAAASSTRIKINSWNTPTHHSSQPPYSRCPITNQPKYTKVHKYQIHKHKSTFQSNCLQVTNVHKYQNTQTHNIDYTN